MTTSPPATVLTIENDDAVRSGISSYLEDRGYRILEAKTGRSGLELFRSEHPDVVLVDLRMPEVDGLEVLEVVTRESPDTPAIVVSGAAAITDCSRGTSSQSMGLPSETDSRHGRASSYAPDRSAARPADPREPGIPATTRGEGKGAYRRAGVCEREAAQPDRGP
ncbi:MAG: response regulator [Phycisphaerales bacterium]|nr:MAG: response regulator [Phycisphaerales bacterium]